MRRLVRDDRGQRDLVALHPTVVDLDGVARDAVAGIDAWAHRHEVNCNPVAVEHVAQRRGGRTGVEQGERIQHTRIGGGQVFRASMGVRHQHRPDHGCKADQAACENVRKRHCQR